MLVRITLSKVDRGVPVGLHRSSRLPSVLLAGIAGLAFYFAVPARPAEAALTCADNNTQIVFSPPLTNSRLSGIGVLAALGGCTLGPPTSGEYSIQFPTAFAACDALLNRRRFISNPNPVVPIDWSDGTRSHSRENNGFLLISNLGFLGVIELSVTGVIDAGYSSGSTFLHTMTATFDPADCARGIPSLNPTVDLFQII
jgi:hypothetical protein